MFFYFEKSNSSNDDDCLTYEYQGLGKSGTQFASFSPESRLTRQANRNSTIIKNEE